jgi:flagellar basal body-associated protein FliL
MKEFWQLLKQMNKKTLRIVLFSVAGALAVAAAVVFIVLWNEGVTAGQNAQAVLDASGLMPETTETSSAGEKSAAPAETAQEK